MIIVGKLEEIIKNLKNWARSWSFWPLTFGTACCAIEMMVMASPRTDCERRGILFYASSPRHADVIIIAGTINLKMKERLRRLYEQMPDPKWVVAMGACEIGGGPFWDGYNVAKGADKTLPVDIYVPGCPPRPENLLEALIKLQEIIKENSMSRYERKNCYICKKPVEKDWNSCKNCGAILR